MVNPPISVVLPLVLDAVMFCRRGIALRYPALLLLVAKVRPHIRLHDPHRPNQHGRGQYCIGVLVEGWILEIVIVQGDVQSKREDQDTEHRLEHARAFVSKSGPCHQTGGIDHGKLVHELVLTLQGRTKRRTPKASLEISCKCDEECLVVSMEAQFIMPTTASQTNNKFVTAFTISAEYVVA